MIKNFKLSHSGLELYNSCPKAFKLKYIDGYREKTTSSALTFGSAIGSTLQMIILDRKESLTKEESEIIGTDPYKFFDDKFSTTQINGEEINLVNSPLCYYYKGDWNPDILKNDDWKIIEDYRKQNDFLDIHTWELLYNEVLSGHASEAEKSFMSLHFWLSLRRKGHLMILEFIDKIAPKIKKVYEIEGPISIKNGVGDEIIGFLDLVCDYEVEPGVIKKVIVDFKTSSQKYSKKKLDESQQLSLYDYDREIGYVGYIVAIKEVKTPKRGERVGETFTEFQELFGETSQEVQERIIEGIDETLNKIKNGEFPENKGTCTRMFGKRCWAYELCYNNDDSKLIKKEKI